MEEPSVLDFIKSKLDPSHRKETISFREALGIVEPVSGKEQIIQPEPKLSEHPRPVTRTRQPWPWKLMVGFTAAIIAQFMLEPPRQSLKIGLFFYGIATVMIIFSWFSREIMLSPGDQDERQISPSNEIRYRMLYSCIPLTILAFLAFGGNRFNLLNVSLWAAAIITGILAFWKHPSPVQSGHANRFENWLNHLREGFQFKISSWNILVILVCLLAAFFRLYRLNAVPGEMFSDHAEKLLDVSDVLNGQYSIFFPRNTGREAFQMYLTALVATVFGTGLTFTSLKIGTVLAGLLTLPYIYLLGRELGNRWIGLLALVLAGIAYWPNVISRVALRFALYPLFTAPTLYYLIRGLKHSRRNDFILAGIALGLGLHGYSPMRIVPLVVVLAIFIYLLHNRKKEKFQTALWGLLILGFISLIVFLPLLRYMADEPDMFGYRLFSRLGTTERVYPGPILEIFRSNLWNAVIMPFWKNGNIWVHSIPDRPALDVVSASAFFLGVIVLILNYLKKRDWSHLFILLSIPALMMPSILSLAFPDENPSLNRTGAAYIPIFITCAFALEVLLRRVFFSGNSIPRKWSAVIIGIVLLSYSAVQNYSLVFDKFSTQFLNGAWNTSEIGHVIRSFADSAGGKNQAFVVPFPYWVDTRLVGINAGFPDKDYALWPDSFESTTMISGPKLFIIKPEDQESASKIQSIYPDGFFETYKSRVPGKEFLMFFTPPE